VKKRFAHEDAKLQVHTSFEMTDYSQLKLKSLSLPTPLITTLKVLKLLSVCILFPHLLLKFITS